VELGNGRRMHSSVALAVVQDMAGVLEFQVTQRAVDHFDVQLVSDGQRNWAEMEAEIRENFRVRFGPQALVSVREVREIHREQNGKRRLWVVPPGAA
jgi:hypothetical protein